MTRLRSVGISLLAVPLVLAVGCGGGSSPEDEIADVAKDHMTALGQFDASGICGPISLGATEAFEEDADEAVNSASAIDEAGERIIPASGSSYCEFIVQGDRETLEEEYDGEEREFIDALAKGYREAEIINSELREDGLSGTVTLETNVSFKENKGRGQAIYALTNEDGEWVVDEVTLIEPGEDPDEEGMTFFPFDRASDIG